MRTRLAVPDISCEGCKATLERALAPVPGVDAVEVDVAGRLVDVLQGYEVAAREEVT